MITDSITEIGIDSLERLYIKPSKEKFVLIYRTATAVHWENNKNVLYSPKPREWSYFDWYKQMIEVVKDCNSDLILTDQTKWINISDELKNQITSL